MHPSMSCLCGAKYLISMAKTSFPDTKLTIISFCLLLTKAKDKTMEYQAASIFSLHTVVAIIKWK